MNQVERSEMIEEYGRGYNLLTAALGEVPLEAREFRPALHAWSIHELIVHMADSEIIGVTRARKLIAEPSGTLMGYDDALWADELDYQNQSMEDALQIFRLLRQTTYHLLKVLPEPVFAQSVIHPDKGIYPEYGEAYTLDKWLHIYTRHVREHVEQLNKTYQTWKEKIH